MQEETMTKTQKDKWLERLYMLVLAIVCPILIYSFTDKQETNKKLIDKVQEIDKSKPNYEYVDKKCFETKQEISSQFEAFKGTVNDMREEQKIMGEDIKEILRYQRK